MRKRLVYVQGPGGSIVYKCTYEDIDEMLNDVKILEKPSMFGARGFRIVIQLAEEG